jgi:hypothetical protein
MGFGVNVVTGDYSRGATGLWIENGQLTHAVEEVTIAGNLAGDAQKRDAPSATTWSSAARWPRPRCASTA